MKTFSGFNCGTAESLILDAGVFFKNYDVQKDTYDTAMAAGKGLGATRGGGTFTATPTTRNLEVDGVKTVGRGMIRFDSWAVTMLANLLEVTAKTFRDALGAASLTPSADGKYDIIRAKNYVENTDYIDNITWMGTVTGSPDEPVIIQIYSALSTSGLSMSMTDKAEAVLAVTFTATQDICGGSQSLDLAPFAIFYPKLVPSPRVNIVTSTATAITGIGVSGAEIIVEGGTIPADTKDIVSASMAFSVAIPAQADGTEITVVQRVGGRLSVPVVVTVKGAE